MAVICVPLTTTQKNAIQEAGVVLGAGYASQAECEAECGGGGGTIATTCCAERLLPETLYGTITGASGGCECMNGLPFTLTWNGVDSWVSEGLVIADCADITNTLIVLCQEDDTWDISANIGACPSPTIAAATLVSCNPLIITQALTMFNCSCGATFATLTITE